MDGFRNGGASTGNASTNTRGGNVGGGGGGYYNHNNKNQNNRNKFNGRRNSNNNNNNAGTSNTTGGGNPNANRVPNSPSKNQLGGQTSPSHYTNGTGSFNFNQDYNGPTYQNRNDNNNRNFGAPNYGANKFNSNNMNSPNGGGNNRNKKFNNKRRGGGGGGGGAGNNYGHNNYNNYQQGNNLNGYAKNNEQMNRSLTKDSPNGSFSEATIPTSISLDNFESKHRSPVMTSSYSFTNGGSQSPTSLSLMKSFIPTCAIIEQEALAEAAVDGGVSQNGDATSFYGSPMSHNEATLKRHLDAAAKSTTPNGTSSNSLDDDSIGSPTVVSKAESKSKTDDQISSLSSSSSPDSRVVNNDETSESQILVTASEGEMSFGNDEPSSNVENTIMNPNDSAEHESLSNLMANTKITEIDEFIKQQNDVMSTLMGASAQTSQVTSETSVVLLAETNASGVVNYNNANNDELDGIIAVKPEHKADEKACDEHNTSSSSSSSSSTSSGESSSTTMSSTTTASPQSSIDPSSSSSSSSSLNNDAAGCLNKDSINIQLDIEYDKEAAPIPANDEKEKAATSEAHSTTQPKESSSSSNEEVTCLVSKLVSDVISQAIQNVPAPIAYDEIEMDDDDDEQEPPVKPVEKFATDILKAAIDNDHGSYHRGHEQQDMTQRESILNLKKIDEDDEETSDSRLQIDDKHNVSFVRDGEENKRRSIERGHMNSPTGEVDLTKMEAMNSQLSTKATTPPPVEAKPQTSKTSKKSQEPVVDCFSCNII